MIMRRPETREVPVTVQESSHDDNKLNRVMMVAEKPSLKEKEKGTWWLER